MLFSLGSTMRQSYFLVYFTGVFLACSAEYPKKTSSFKSFDIGDKVDSLDGIYVYYNGGIGNIEGRNTAPDGYNLGLKYQCVEFVKRYYYYHYKHKMPNSYGHAKDFFDAGVKDGKRNKDRNLVQYKNPSSSTPKKGDLIVMSGNMANPYGHVAIVSSINKNNIEIIQQNPGPNEPSRIQFTCIKSNGTFYIANKRVLGWLRKE